ncbi:MAG: hypothetical protein L6R41_007245 [Letrouitia leprolyta]|nr:MAG: hypothetical protein L6R41_007245 [Letrouitia leprolyta]
MDLPNELILQALGYLSNKDLKQTRLVCRQLALLGLKALNVETIYLSPRKKDMEVFDTITQHPILSKSVRHVVYDMAQFVNLRPEHYFQALCEQFVTQACFRSDFKMQELVQEYARPSGFVSPRELFARFLRGPRLNDGPSHLRTLAQEQGNLLSREFSRNRIIDWGSINGSQGDLLTNGQIYNTENNAVALQRNDVEVEAVYVEFRSHMMIKPYNYTDTPLEPYANPSIAELRKNGISDGSLEVFKVVQLLRSAAKQPSRLVIPADAKGQGLPPAVLDFETCSDPTDLSVLWNGIQALDIKISRLLDEDIVTGNVVYFLNGLQVLFHQAPGLQKLSLEFPFYVDHYRSDNDRFYNYHRVFPLATEWYGFHLTSLKICEGLRQADKLTRCGLSNLHDYGMKQPSYFESMSSFTTYLDNVCHYIEKGGRHPGLRDSEPNSASSKYMIELNKTLHGLRQARATANR